MARVSNKQSVYTPPPPAVCAGPNTCHQELGVRYFTDANSQAIALVGGCKCTWDMLERYVFPDWTMLFSSLAPSIPPPLASPQTRCESCGNPVVGIWHFVKKLNGVEHWDGGTGICPCRPYPKLSAVEIEAKWLTVRQDMPALIAALNAPDGGGASHGLRPMGAILPPPQELFPVGDESVEDRF